MFRRQPFLFNSNSAAATTTAAKKLTPEQMQQRAKVPRVSGDTVKKNRWTGINQQIMTDFVLPVRIPALLLLGFAIYNTRLYSMANEAFDKGARFGTETM